MHDGHSEIFPTITEEDLTNFHHLHYSHTDLPSKFFIQCHYEDEEDALGYYPDGEKRTLTDEEIAIFRHSEIQALLKERERQTSPSQDPEAVVASIESSGPTSLVQDSPVLHQKEGLPHNSPRRQNTSSVERSHGAYNSGHPQQNTYRMRKRRKKQRKCDQKESRMPENDYSAQFRSEQEPEYTYRRLAREMDEVKETTVYMDY